MNIMPGRILKEIKVGRQTLKYSLKEVVNNQQKRINSGHLGTYLFGN